MNVYHQAMGAKVNQGGRSRKQKLSRKQRGHFLSHFHLWAPLPVCFILLFLQTPLLGFSMDGTLPLPEGYINSILAISHLQRTKGYFSPRATVPEERIRVALLG